MNPATQDLKQLQSLMQEGQAQKAAVLCSKLLKQYPDDVDTLIVASHFYQKNADFERMLQTARQACDKHPNHIDAAFRYAECLLYTGEIRATLEIMGSLQSVAKHDPELLTRIAEFYAHCSRHEDALVCYQQAKDLQPSNVNYVYNLAASQIANGDMQTAEELFNRVIYLKPDDYDAWQNRSTLRKQTEDNNHVKQLQFVKERLSKHDKGQMPVCFALAKELEDLERYEESFAYLQEGAARRKNMMSYEVATDEAVMQKIASVFNRESLESPHTSNPTKRPVFVLGLPRSGTTLVDRIISSHSQADSMGESNALAFAVMRAAAGKKGNLADKISLIEQSANMDFAQMGEFYAHATENLSAESARLVDKTPLNFLYLGLIHLSMPGAKIIHLRRNPVDSCYAMYKTLFRMGYPFTYSLQDVGRYYIAYHALMAHWRELIPGAFLDVDYENLVNNQEVETRRILEYLNLDWEDSCLDFHKHKGAAATASAAQVRQPIYNSSVGRWKSYQEQLAPFVSKLKEHGIDVS
jgi:tetratricopeptide (TPR) repeat protein